MKLENITTPTSEELLAEFQFIATATYKGVSGVWVVDSGKLGPTVAVTIQTHGNEICGLAALWYLRNAFGLASKVVQGRVMVVLNNLRATTSYFALAGKTLDETMDARYCDLNMNRLPRNLRELTAPREYELKRALELLPIWGEFDAALDIHSASVPIRPIIIQVGLHERVPTLIERFPAPTHYIGIEEHQSDAPMLTFCGNPHGPSIPVVGIEAGCHEERGARQVASACALLFLEGMGAIADVGLDLPKMKEEDRRKFQITGSFYFPPPNQSDWELTRNLIPEASLVRNEEVIARNRKTGETHTSHRTDLIALPPKGKIPRKPKEEVFFYCRIVEPA